MTTVATVNELGSYSHNPRGNLWYNDESSYGKKMLLKMGWKKGKGLGKKEDGIKENLKVKFKSTNSGLGFKDDSYYNVMKTEYESILKSLQSEYPQQESVNVYNNNTGHKNQDLTQKSRIVKSKIRYPKLYYGKDVSKYSDKDMKSIFICSLPFKDKKEELKDPGVCLMEESLNSGLCLKEDSKDSKLCIKEESENQLSKPQETISHLSISDYFSMKMKEKKGMEQMKKYNTEVKQEETNFICNKTNYEIENAKSDFECNEINKGKEEQYTSECSKSVCNIDEEKKDFQLKITEEAVRSSSKKKHKKKRKNSEMDVSGGNSKIVLPEIEEERKDVMSPKKKRKKLSDNSPYEGTFNEKKMQEESNLSADQLSVSHKKRKCHKESSNSVDTEEFLLGQSNIQSDIIPHKRKKKSHRKDNISSYDIELISVTSLKDEVSTGCQLADNLSTKGSTETTDETLTNVDNISSMKKHKKSKKKFNSIEKLKSCLKSKKNEYVVKNVSFNENVSYLLIDSVNQSTSSDSDCEDKTSTDVEITSSGNPEPEKDSGESKTGIEVSNLEKQKESSSSSISETVSEEKLEQCDSLSSLPSSNSSYYNSWVESQQQALKMKLYQDLLRGIRKHDILKTTNLSFIKGYGNWGFK